jgi:hypothetical protein
MTTIALEDAAIGHGPAAEVPAISARFEPGAPSVLAVETDERPMLVSLLAAGRMAPDAGSVTLDGSADPRALRRRVAVVDTPFVAEPTPGVSLATVVREDLSVAGRPTSKTAVRELLARHGLADYTDVPIRVLPTANRISLLADLALERPGVDTIIVTSPERHGGNPADWFGALTAITDRGITVAVVTDAPTRDILLTLGARDALTQEAAS